VVVFVVVPLEEIFGPGAGILLTSEPFRIIWLILHGLELAAEYGLSLETCGREYVFVTPRSAIKKATGLEVIELPRSARMVS